MTTSLRTPHKMVIVTGIKTGIDIVKIFAKFAKSTGKYSPGLRAIDKYAPPHYRPSLRKAYKYGEAAVAAKGVYDLLNIDNTKNAIPKKTFRTPAKRQTRNYMVKSRTKRFNYNNCYPRKRYSSR